jgi:hypothetical protein
VHVGARLAAVRSSLRFVVACAGALQRNALHRTTLTRLRVASSQWLGESMSSQWQRKGRAVGTREGGAGRGRAPVVLLGIILLSSVVAVLPSGVAPSSSTYGFINYAGPASTDSSGEPTIGVNWNTGNVMMMTGGFPLLNIPPSQHVSRISFDDSVSPATATWTDVTPPFMITNLDPILNTDPTTGLTFAGGDDGACTILSRTTNDGASWLPAGNSCTGTVDHPTVGQGVSDPAAPVQPVSALDPHVVYVCQQESVDECAVSYDGGNAFLPSTPLQCGFINPGLFGHLRVGPDGDAYVPFSDCASSPSGDVQGVAVSETNGLTWTGHAIATIPAASGEGDPSIAAGRGDTVPSGRLYFAATNGNTFHAVVATSTNDGASWSTPVDLNVASTRVTGSAIGVKNIAFPTVIAGDDDRAAFAFLGTKNGTGNADPYTSTSFSGEWHLYVAFTTDGGGNWTSVDVTPSDPVQRGMICLGGVSCSSGRNLLDFMDVVTDANGRVLVGYADGCLGCSTVADSTHSLATIARQTCGPSLFASKGNVEGTGTCPTAPTTSAPLLSGTLYMTGHLPEGNPDSLIAGDTLTPVAPTSPVPKVVTNALVHGANAGALYDAHWFKDGPAQLRGNVTVNVWAVAAGTAGGGSETVTVSLYDAGSTTFAALTPTLATQTLTLPLTATPRLYSVTFTGLSANLANGFEVFLTTAARGDVTVLYDATSTPSDVVFT